MDVSAALVTDRETTEAMEPGNGPFDHPPADTEATAMRRASAREDRCDAACPQTVTMRLGVVAAVALESVGPTPRTPASPAHRG